MVEPIGFIELPLPVGAGAPPSLDESEGLDHACDLLGAVLDSNADPVALALLGPQIRAFLAVWGALE